MRVVSQQGSVSEERRQDTSSLKIHEWQAEKRAHWDKLAYQKHPYQCYFLIKVNLPYPPPSSPQSPVCQLVFRLLLFLRCCFFPSGKWNEISQSSLPLQMGMASPVLNSLQSFFCTVLNKLANPVYLWSGSGIFRILIVLACKTERATRNHLWLQIMSGTYQQYSRGILSPIELSQGPRARCPCVSTVSKEESQVAKGMRSNHPHHQKICFPFISLHTNWRSHLRQKVEAIVWFSFSHCSSQVYTFFRL